MDQSLQQIQDSIQKSDAIGIAIGADATLDETAAALGLYLSLKNSGKNVSIASPVDPLVAVSSLVGVDKIATNFGGTTGDLIVSFPYREGEIEKISYTLDTDKLNIVVKAGANGLNFNEADVTYTRGGGAPALLFVVGSNTLNRLGTLFNPDALKNTTIVNIDNKKANQGFGDIVYVNPNASSVSEQVAQLVTGLRLQLDVDTAQNLLSGIMDGTENFQSPITSAAAFEMSGLMLKAGAQRAQRQARSAMSDTPVDSFFQPKTQPQQQRPFPKPFNQPVAAPAPFPRPAAPAANPFMKQSMPPVNNNQMPQAPAAPAPMSAASFFKQKNQPQGQDQQQMDQTAQPKKSPPNDWLTPKIYKGSTQV